MVSEWINGSGMDDWKDGSYAEQTDLLSGEYKVKFSFVRGCKSRRLQMVYRNFQKFLS